MKLTALLAVLMLIAPSAARSEEQVLDSSGRILEIRQQYGDTSYAYDANRNPIYTATNVWGGNGVFDFRDKYGVHVGVGGPGLYPWAVQGTWGSK
ncbi:MAG TPA: hypothetical protein VK463_21090 [Desulfomonilaceae bacterium]|nr:hypothetical protein [Desulfomonilaceae bacterium]